MMAPLPPLSGLSHRGTVTLTLVTGNDGTLRCSRHPSLPDFFWVSGNCDRSDGSFQKSQKNIKESFMGQILSGCAHWQSAREHNLKKVRLSLGSIGKRSAAVSAFVLPLAAVAGLRKQNGIPLL